MNTCYFVTLLKGEFNFLFVFKLSGLTRPEQEERATVLAPNEAGGLRAGMRASLL